MQLIPQGFFSQRSPCKQYTVISYAILEQSNCWPEVEGVVFCTVAQGRMPRATVQNTNPDTEGQLYDCSQITYEITVLLPDQLLF
jgi:hypothetical protein